MNRFQREAFHSVTDLSSDERSNVNLSTKSSPRRRSSPADVMTPKSTQKTTPRGATAILASQIDQEILELRSFYEQHRSEMLSLAATATGAAAATPFVQNRSTAFPQSVDTQDKQTSMMMKSPTKYSRPLVNRGVVNIESESDSISLQEERRLEFQQRRQRQLQKKRLSQHEFDKSCRQQQHQKQQQQQPHDVERSRFEVHPAMPHFALGQMSTPQASKSHAISSFFPPVCAAFDVKNRRSFSNDESSLDVHDGGRRFEAEDGDEIFIPKLNLDELVSEEHVRHDHY